MTGTRLTREERDEIAASVRSGRFGSIDKTAKRLKRSRTTVTRVARQLGVHVNTKIRTSLSNQQVALLDSLLSQGGWTQAEIAQAVGCPVSTVVSRSRKVPHVPLPSASLTDADRSRLFDALQSTPLSDVELALDFKTCPMQIQLIRQARDTDTAQQAPNAKRRRCRGLDGSSRPRLFVHSDSNGKKLFVPTLALWAIRNARKPGAVLDRAKLPENLWQTWQRLYAHRQDVLSYLYHEPHNLNQLVHASTAHKLRRPERDGELFLTEEMVAFRAHSSLRATEAFLRTEQKKGRLPEDFNPLHYQMVSRILKRQQGEPWLSEWLRGNEITRDSAPAYVATPAEIRHCLYAWDYPAILDEPEVNASLDAYRAGLELFPKDTFAHWMTWLYGGPAPRGFFPIRPTVLDLRERRTEAGTRRAADVGKATLWKWKSNPTTWQALQDAIEARAKGQVLPTTEAWQELRGKNQRQQRAMLRYAEKSLLKNALADIGMTTGAWRKLKASAAENGCQMQLDWFIAGELSSNSGLILLSEAQHSELIASKDKANNPSTRLFLPPSWMWKFRAVASRRASRNIASIRGKLEREGSLEMFTAWFLDWTLPGDDFRTGRKWQELRQFVDPTSSISESDAQPPVPERLPNPGEISPAKPTKGAHLFVGTVPDNPDLVDLAVRIDAERTSGKSFNQIALEFCRGNKRKADSLLTQIRRLRSKGRLNI